MIHTHIHTSMHACMHAYIHTCIYIYHYGHYVLLSPGYKTPRSLGLALDP